MAIRTKSARYVAFGTEDGAVGVVDLRNRAEPITNTYNLAANIPRFGRNDTRIRCVKFNKDGTQLYVGVAKGVVRMERSDLRKCEWLCKSKSPVTHICVGDGDIIYTLDGESIKAWESFNSGLDWTIKEVFNPQSAKGRLCIAYYDKWLISGKKDGTIELWETTRAHQQSAYRTIVYEANRGIHALAMCEDRIWATTDNGKLLELTWGRDQDLVITQRRNVDVDYVGCYYSPLIGRRVAEGILVVMVHGFAIDIINPQTNHGAYTIDVPQGANAHSTVQCFAHTSSYLYCGTLDGRIIELRLYRDVAFEVESETNARQRAITSVDCLL